MDRTICITYANYSIFTSELSNNLVKIDTIGDGSCFFHAIISAFFKPYIENTIDRIKFIKQFRKDLSETLYSQYRKLGNGSFLELSRSVDEYSLQSLKEMLDSNLPVDNRFHQFISDVINKDIYILYSITNNVYKSADDLKLLYKNRDSIVILYTPGHYELIGRLNNITKEITTVFNYNDSFIKNIQKELSNLKEEIK